MAVLSLAGFCSQLSGQSGQPPHPAGPVGSAPAAAEAEPGTVYKATARSVVVDVVVTDSSGRPVSGLQRGQFHIKENGLAQTVSLFEPHVGVQPSPVKPLPPLPPGEYTNFPIAPVTDSINVLLLDALNTPLQNEAEVRQAMVKYLKTAPSNARMAIFTLSSRLRFIQGFTSDPTLLLAAINGKKNKANPEESALLDTPQDAEARERLTDMMSDAGASAAAVAALQQFEADQISFQNDQRVRITLDAMQQIARYLAGIPGRKNLIWFSGSFPVNIFPDASMSDPFSATRSYSDEIHKATDLLSIGQVAVYPIDARGLMTAPMYDASVSGSHYARNPSAFSAADSNFSTAQATEHGTMDELARATGGQALYNTNGLKEALARVIENGSNYYTVAYDPTDKTLDGKLRKIDIQVDGKYKLAYRRSYFADDLDGHHTTNAPPVDKSFETAMAPGLPTASQILFSTKILPLDPQPAPGPMLGDNSKLKGPTSRYGIDYAALGSDLRFTVTPDGLHHGLVTINILAYNSEGEPQNWLSRTLRLDVRPDTYADIMKAGLRAHAEIDLPRGIVHLRTGIYDAVSTKMGILDVPLNVRVGAAAAAAK